MVSKKKEENTYQNSDRYVFYFLGSYCTRLDILNYDNYG
jgi:hypothetical protein